MNILGIETSCDETAVALLSFDKNQRCRVVAEEISSQLDIHEKYGGVVPELASREHLKNLPLVMDKVLCDASLELKDISALAVTRGPGLKGCLLIGMGFAKGIAASRGVPLVGVNHIEGHVLAPVMDNPQLEYPFLALIVSGGHTEIVQVNAFADYKIITRTTDDAAGEAFDKSANLLGFGYPGGARLADLADHSAEQHFPLPKVMREAEGFSFSGLKTAIALLIRKNETALQSDAALRGSIARAIQEAIVDALCFKLDGAMKSTGIRRVAVSGGVSANRRLRARVEALSPGNVYFPSMKHCMDNGAMIAYVGGLRFMRGERMALDADVLSRYPVEEIR